MTKSYSNGTPAVSYGYDTSGVANAIGRLTQTSNSVSANNVLAYDALGRVTSSNQITTAGGQMQTYTFGYGYNLAGALTSETLPSGRVIATGYDLVNRPVWLKDSVGSNVTNYIGNPGGTNTTDFNTWVQYTPHGAPYQYARGNKVAHAEEYNSRLQMVESFETLLPSGSSPQMVNSVASMLFVSCPHWGFGTEKTLFAICQAPASTADNGNLLGYDEYLGGPGMSNYQPFTQTATYDSVNRLYTMSDNGGWSRTFAYDQWGNMAVSAYTGWTLNVNTPASDPTMIYNASNRRTDSGQYDAAGNVTGLNGYSNLTYDAENRLLTATSPAAFSYGYDGAGRRVVKSGSSGTTVYVYDAGGMLAAEYNTAAVTAACGVCYLSYDQLGSVRLITDGAGNVVSRHDYLPFGEEVPQGQAGRTAGLGFGGSDGVSQRFTGKERDSESQLDYFGARYYGSALGRFMSPDWSAKPEPVPYADFSNPQTLNQYSYVLNNPLGKADPDGHCGPFTPVCVAIAESPAVQEAGGWISENTSQILVGASAILSSAIAGLESAREPGGYVPGGLTDANGNSVFASKTNQQDSGKTDEKTTKQNGAITEPNTPGKVVADQDGVKVTNNYKSDDHGPAHLHVDGQGESTKVGMNGKPLDGSSELSSKQQKVVDQSKGAIRKAVDQIQRYKKYNDQ